MGLTCCAIEKSFNFRTAKDQGTKFEFTVVQKFNLPAGRQVIAPSRNRDVIDFGAPFLLLFLEKQKSKR